MQLKSRAFNRAMFASPRLFVARPEAMSTAPAMSFERSNHLAVRNAGITYCTFRPRGEKGGLRSKAQFFHVRVGCVVSKPARLDRQLPGRVLHHNGDVGLSCTLASNILSVVVTLLVCPSVVWSEIALTSSRNAQQVASNS
jgi:hypothetical protein